MAAFLIVLLLIQFGLGLVGAWLMESKGRSAEGGFCLGFFLSGAGLIIAAVLPRSEEEEIRRAVRIANAVTRGAGPQVVPPKSSPYGLPSLTVPSRLLPGRMLADDILAAAKEAPDADRAGLVNSAQSLLFSAGAPQPVAFCFGRADDKVERLVLLYPNKLVVAKASTGAPSVDSYYSNIGCNLAATSAVNGDLVELTVEGKTMTGVNPVEAGRWFIDCARRASWIGVHTTPLAPELEPTALALETSQPSVDASSDRDPVVAVKTLKRLLDAGLIAEDEFIARRSVILDGLI